MNKKGFTLIELLAVIIVLSSISLVVVSSVTSSLTKRDVKECEEQKELAKSAAKIYFSLKGENHVTVRQLLENGFLSEEDKTNRLDMDHEIKIENAKYKYIGECK